MDGFEDEPGGTSIAAPLIRALLAAAIAFGVYWLVFAQDDLADDPVLEIPTATESDDIAVGQPAPTPTPLPTIESTPTQDPVEAPVGTPGVGVSVQVLNGTDDGALFASAVQALEALGYTVTQSGRARQDYSQTTIFATAGQEAAATALQTADPRFTTIGENPGNLTSQINIHVVVGEDWTTTDG